MNSADVSRRKQSLLDRFLAGEIDRANYDHMLAEIERMGTAAALPAEHHGRESFAPRVAPDQRFLSKGDRPTVAGVAAGMCEGALLGSLRIEHRLGRGGMGEVWKAYDTVGDRPVVIKVLPPELQNNPEEMARFKDTFRKIHALQHQSICPTYSLGQDRSVGYFLVMKYLDAVTLSAHLAKSSRGGLPLAEVVRLIAPVAAALDYAHSRNIVHRDIKPENIMLGDGGADVQLVDFGLAAEIRNSVSRTSRVRMESTGTYPYMAPEQWKGELQDSKTDQYALGVVAYELLSGRLPFASSDSGVLRQCALNDAPPAIAQQSAAINGALAKAMAKDRPARFASCAQFVEALAKNTGISAAPAVRTENVSGNSSQRLPAGRAKARRATAVKLQKLANQSNGQSASSQPGSLVSKITAQIDAIKRAVEVQLRIPPKHVDKFWIGAGLAALLILTLGFYFLFVFDPRTPSL